MGESENEKKTACLRQPFFLFGHYRADSFRRVCRKQEMCYNENWLVLPAYREGWACSAEFCGFW